MELEIQQLPDLVPVPQKHSEQGEAEMGVWSTLGAKEVPLHLIPAPPPMEHTMDGFKGLSLWPWP